MRPLDEGEAKAFKVNLERVQILVQTHQPIEGELGEWLVAALREMEVVKLHREELSPKVAKPLRDMHLAAAAVLLHEPSPHRAARVLFDQAQLLNRQRPLLRLGGFSAPTPLAHLRAANTWYDLPECERTYLRFLTKQA